MPDPPNRSTRPTNPDRRIWNGLEVDLHLQDEWLERLNKLDNFRLTSICEGHAGERRGFRGTPHLILRLTESYNSLITSTWYEVRTALYGKFRCGNETSLCRASFDFISNIRLSRGILEPSEDKFLIRIDATNHRIDDEPEAWLANFFNQAVILAEAADQFFGEILARQKQFIIESGKYIAGAYLKYRYGVQCPSVLIDAVHAAKPKADAYTGKIVEAVARATGCHAIVATVTREVADINRTPSEENAGAVEEYRRTIQHLFETTDLLKTDRSLSQPVLHLAIHGMKDRPDADIELGTCFGGSCSQAVLEWVQYEIEAWAQNTGSLSRKPMIVVNRKFSGDTSKQYHRKGDKRSSYHGYGLLLNTIQIEFAYWLRKEHRKEIVSLLTCIADKFQLEFGI